MTLFGFGKKKEKEINAPVCTCNGNCSVSETVEPENLNNCCQDIQGRICCIKVLGSGCASCLVMLFMRTHNPPLKQWGFP